MYLLTVENNGQEITCTNYWDDHPLLKNQRISCRRGREQVARMDSYGDAVVGRVSGIVYGAEIGARCHDFIGLGAYPTPRATHHHTR